MTKASGKKATKARVSKAVEVPRALRSFVSQRTRLDGHQSESEYIKHLIVEDQRRVQAEHRRLMQMIRDGLESGPGMTFDAQWADRMKARLNGQVRARRKAG